MYYSNISYDDIVNGPGLRISLFVSGCTNHCKNCFNPQTWNFHYGQPFTEETLAVIFKTLKEPLYQGITILGGEPMELENQPAVAEIATRIRTLLPEKSIWIYTGFLYDKDLIPGGKRYLPGITEQILQTANVLVDGPFMENQKSMELLFRGSANQRLIDLKQSNSKHIKEWTPAAY